METIIDWGRWRKIRRNKRKKEEQKMQGDGEENMQGKN